MEVIPNSKLLNKIFPPFPVACFRGLIGLTITMCFYDLIDKRHSEWSAVIFNYCIAGISLYVCYYSPVLEHILHENFEEKIRKSTPIPERVKGFFEKLKIKKRKV